MVAREPENEHSCTLSRPDWVDQNHDVAPAKQPIMIKYKRIGLNHKRDTNLLQDHTLDYSNRS